MNSIRIANLMVATALTVGLGIGTPAAAEHSDAARLKPHRAVYAMSLAGSSGVGGPSQVRGVMYYEMVETCEAWKIDTKVLLRSVYGGEDEVENLRKIQTWEAKDGLGFRFRLDETAQGQPEQQLRGVAVIDGSELAGVAEFSAPQSTQSDLPKGATFPTRHMAELIRRSAAGDTHFTRVVFDGASLDDPYEVSALIGEAPASVMSSDVQATLGEGARWKVRLAYFPVSKSAETPEFELSVLFRDDGIVENMRQDYDDHSLDARLRQIEFLPRPVCEVAANPNLEPAPPPADDEDGDEDETR